MAKTKKSEKTGQESKDWLTSPLKALADTTRLKILLMLEGRPRTVGEIVEFFDLSQPTITRHLQALSHAGLAKRSQKGRKVLYKIDNEKVGIMCLELTKCFPCCCESVQVQVQPFAGESCCSVDPEQEAKPAKKAKKKDTGRAVGKRTAGDKLAKKKGTQS